MWKCLIVNLAFLFSFHGLSTASCCKNEPEIVIEASQLENIGDLIGSTRVWFVDNTNSSFGDGSFANPFNTLLDAEMASSANDVIYVFPGDGTSTGMNQGFRMKSNQKILGAGIDHIFLSPRGNVRVLAGSTSLPFIINTDLNVAAITLANSCEVAGLHISATNGGDGILGGDPNPVGPNTLGISHTNIHDNTIDNASVTNGAIYLANCQGDLMISNNFITDIVSGNFPTGINLSNQIFPVSAYAIILNNTILNVGGKPSFGIFIESFATTGHINCIVEDNFVSDCQTGFQLTGVSTSSEATICGKIRKNILKNCHDTGLVISSSKAALINAEISCNHFNANGVVGFEANSFQNSTVCLKLMNNVSDNGFNLFQYDSSTFNMASSNGTLSGIERINNGPFSTLATINYVPLGTCNCLKQTCDCQ